MKQMTAQTKQPVIHDTGIHVICTWEGGGETKRAITLKFKAPYSEWKNWVQLTTMVDEQVFLFAKWDSVDANNQPITVYHQIATAVYTSKTDAHGETVMKFQTDAQSIFPNELTQMKIDCKLDASGMGKTIVLVILTAQDIATP